MKSYSYMHKLMQESQMDQQVVFAQKYIYVFVHMCVHTCLHVTIVLMKNSGSQPS